MWLIRLLSTSAHRTFDRCSVSECFKKFQLWQTDRQTGYKSGSNRGEICVAQLKFSATSEQKEHWMSDTNSLGFILLSNRSRMYVLAVVVGSLFIGAVDSRTSEYDWLSSWIKWKLQCNGWRNSLWKFL